MIDKLNDGIEFICVDDDKGIYTVSYKDNNLFTNRFDSNLPGKTNGKDNFRNIREPLIINYQEHFSNLSRNFS